MEKHKKNKRSLEIEKYPCDLPDEIQHKIIDKILALNNIGVIAKAFLIRKEYDVVYKVAYEYLESKGFSTILKHLRRPDYYMPDANSASKWTSQNEFQYYLIKILDEPEEKIFGSEKWTHIPIDVENFLKKHSNSFLVKYKQEIENQNVKFPSKFASHYCMYLKEIRESHLDNLMVTFLENIFGESFIVSSQTYLELIVNESNCDAISDVCVQDGFLATIGVVVVEDKTDKNNEGDPVAQLIAEGIAIAQQANWKEEWPVYMILCKGFEINFYKATFSKTFLNNVRNGFDCVTYTFIYHYSGKDISLRFEDGRWAAAQIFLRIKEECLERRLNK